NRGQLERSIDTQQSETAIFVVGNPIGVAKTFGNDNLAAGSKLAIGNNMTLLTHNQTVAVFDRFRHGREGRAATLGKWSKSAYHCSGPRLKNSFHHLGKHHCKAAAFAFARHTSYRGLPKTLHAAAEKRVAR